MVKYLVDTDVLIDHFKGKAYASEILEKVGGIEQVLISAVTVGEVLEGVVGSPKEYKKVKSVLSKIRVLFVDRKVAEVFAEIRADLRRRGSLIENMDILIAATARVHGLTLITGNTREFKRISGLKLYSE